MDQERIDEVKGQIILDELAEKERLEAIVNQSANHYYFGGFAKSFGFLSVLIIIVLVCDFKEVSLELVLPYLIAFSAYGESRRQSKRLDAFMKLQKIQNR